MLELGSLWWVVILAAVAVWIASSVVWMVLPHHRSDFGKLPNEAEVMGVLGTENPPRMYRFPHCSTMEEMKDPAYLEKLNKGPVGHLTLVPAGPPNMGKMLGLWFGYTLLASFLTGYVARHAFGPGESFGAVFQLTGAVAFGIYALQPLPDAIWTGKPWNVALKSVADGVAYALITGAIFAWAWPPAA